jgi:hypothetical protein
MSLKARLGIFTLPAGTVRLFQAPSRSTTGCLNDVHTEVEQYAVVIRKQSIKLCRIESQVGLYYRAADKVPIAVSIWKMHSEAFFGEWAVLAMRRRALCALRTAFAALLAVGILKLHDSPQRLTAAETA